MIRFGPSGIPLSCKGRTLLDGIKDVHKLGLTAIEVQFLRMNVRTRPAQEEEIGLKAREVPEKFVIGVNRGRDYERMRVEDLDKEVERGDMLHYLKGGVAEEFYRFPLLGQLCNELDVDISVHTPYYMKLTDVDTDLVDKSKRGFKYGAVMANSLDADVIVTHLGLVEETEDKEELIDIVVDNLRELRDWYSDNFDRKIEIGIENQTGEDIFGNFEDVLDICKKVSGTTPIINFAHLKAEEDYPLDEPEDFGEIFQKCKNFVKDSYYVNFSGVSLRGRDEYRFTPIKRGDLDFEPLVKYLIESNENVTIISGSPLKEHDAMYMKVIFERIFSKEMGR